MNIPPNRAYHQTTRAPHFGNSDKTRWREQAVNFSAIGITSLALANYGVTACDMPSLLVTPLTILSAAVLHKLFGSNNNDNDDGSNGPDKRVKAPIPVRSKDH